VIGSAAGVALMGLEKVDFFWYDRMLFAQTERLSSKYRMYRYAKKISLSALAGYSAGIGTYVLQQQVRHTYRTYKWRHNHCG
jgi:hypothetical protein